MNEDSNCQDQQEAATNNSDDEEKVTISCCRGPKVTRHKKMDRHTGSIYTYTHVNPRERIYTHTHTRTDKPLEIRAGSDHRALQAEPQQACIAAFNNAPLCPLRISQSDAPIGRRQIRTNPSDVALGPHLHLLNDAQ